VIVPSPALATSREDFDRSPIELKTLAEVSVANDATLVTVDVLPPSVRPPRRRVLSHEEEVDLSRRIESGERDAIQALVGSALLEIPLRALATEVRSGRLLPSNVLRNADENADKDGIREDLARLLERAASVAARAGLRPRTEAIRERRRARSARIATDLAAMRLERHIFARWSRELRARGVDERTRRAFARALGSASQATHEFVAANFGLVVTYARRFIGQGLDMHDLVQEGQLGLIRAVEKFDWRRGHRFSTYAAWWVRQAMARAIADQSRTIRVPVHLLESRHKLERVRRTLAQQGHRDPSEEELARESGLPVDKVRAIVGLVREPLRLEAPLGEDGDGGQLGDMVADTRATAPDDELAHERMHEQTRALLDLLSPREQQLLRLRFGMDGGPGHTLEEVGKTFNLSRERVRQIEAAALKKLRAVSEERDLGSYIGL
jgi:RNA polymerase primary sigma factor